MQHTHKPTTSAIIGCPVCFPEKHTPLNYRLISGDSFSPEEAEIIVRAVNAHDELVMALKRIMGIAETNLIGVTYQKIHEEVCSVLKKAEGK